MQGIIDVGVGEAKKKIVSFFPNVVRLCFTLGWSRRFEGFSRNTLTFPSEGTYSFAEIVFRISVFQWLRWMERTQVAGKVKSIGKNCPRGGSCPTSILVTVLVFFRFATDTDLREIRFIRFPLFFVCWTDVYFIRCFFDKANFPI